MDNNHNHENTGKSNDIKDKKIDEAIKVVSQVLKGLYEKNRFVLENPEITGFIKTNFGTLGLEYYEKIKENYLK